MNSRWKRYKSAPVLIQIFFKSKWAAVSRHYNAKTFLNFNTVCLHRLLPFFRSVNTLSLCKLSRGLVERSLVRLGGACLHALSVA